MRQKLARLLRPTSRTSAGGSVPAAEIRRRCERDRATYLAALAEPTEHDARPAPPPPALLAALGALLPVEDGTDTTAVPFDALLRTLDRALESDGEREVRLAIGLSDTAVALRPRSKGAWRQRARALEAAGRLDEAIPAYERYVALDGTEPRYAGRAEVLATQRDALTEAARLVGPTRDEDAGELSETAGGFVTAVQSGRPLSTVRNAFTAHLTQAVAARGATDPDVRRLAALYGTHSRLLRARLVPPDHLADASPLGVHDLRGYLEGRSVCVVRGEVELDPEEYDLVLRCDELGDQAAGDRVDIHAVRATRLRDLAVPVDVRLVWDERPGPVEWRQAVRTLRPGTQRYVGDDSLRRPLSDPALCGDEVWGREPSTAFVMLRLLDFLDVSPRIDLRADVPPHQVLRATESDWLQERAVAHTRTRINLR